MCYIVLKAEKGEGRRSVSASFQTQQEPPHAEPAPGKSQSLARAGNTSGLCARRQLLRAKAQQELLSRTRVRCSQPAAVPAELWWAAGPGVLPRRSAHVAQLAWREASLPLTSCSHSQHSYLPRNVVVCHESRKKAAGWQAAV